MAWKKPAIYLTNGKKPFCGLCKCDMTLLKKEFEMKQTGGNETISVFEEILFCPECKNFFITQEMSRALVRKHPGYYVDTSLYDLRSSNKVKKKQTAQLSDKTNAVSNNGSRTQTYNPGRNTVKNSAVQTRSNLENTIRPTGLKAQIYLSNTYSAANNICPFCRSVMSREDINIPVIEMTGDSYRHDTEKVRFCYKCRKAFITKEMALYILSKINDSLKDQKTIKVENVTIQWDEDNNKYLFNPTSENSWDIFFPSRDYEKVSVRDDTPAEMELNQQSFLGAMGYSTNESEARRRIILVKCVTEFGKSRVLQQLRFNMDMRLKQKDGATRYQRAINAWRGDIWYVENKL